MLGDGLSKRSPALFPAEAAALWAGAPPVRPARRRHGRTLARSRQPAVEKLLLQSANIPGMPMFSHC